MLDIIAQTALAKGTFYYYFSIKEAVLCTIFKYYSNQVVDSLKWDDVSLPTVDKLIIFLHKIFAPSPLDKLIIKLFDENHFSLLSKTWQKKIFIFFNLY